MKSTVGHFAVVTSFAAITMSKASLNRVAVIGAGAAGLIAAHQLRKNGLDVEVYERESEVGGVWRCQSNKQSEPYPNAMYQSLVTNLPKQVMSYLDFPFDEDYPSFLTHDRVYEYLRRFSLENELRPLINFRSNVLKICPRWDTLEVGRDQWELEYIDHKTEGGAVISKTYDYVVVCNGHYDKSANQNIDGIDLFEGDVMHSKFYNEPGIFASKRVLCIGGNSSGIDIAREVATVADQVYVSNRTSSQPSEYRGGLRGNVSRHPGIKLFQKPNKVMFTDDEVVEPNCIILCTGYEFDFPFLISAAKRLPLSWEDKCVSPLYKQVFHFKHPSLSFIGLNFSIAPFSMFEIQANLIASVYSNKVQLPPMEEREDDFTKEMLLLTEMGLRRRDFHMMGEKQWPYMRDILEMADSMNETVDKELKLREMIYRDCGIARCRCRAGEDDVYRRREYKHLNVDACTFVVD